MTRYFTPRVWLATVVVASGAAGMMTAPAESMEASTVGTDVGTIHVENRQTATGQSRGGNPLWAIPLKELSATRERPLFSPSRRASIPTAASSYTAAAQTTRPAAPERPQLSLVGTVAGDKQGFGIFFDRLANTVIRLKTGEQHKGWILREVRTREAVLERDDRTAILAMPVLPGAAPAGRDEDRNSGR